MYCILHPDVALRSWRLVPWAYYWRGVRNARKLTREEFALLELCDSKTDLLPTPLLRSLLDRGLALPCERGLGGPSPWQKMDCDNRYFPAVNWMVTGKCNFNCLHCFNAADNAPLMSEWTLEEAGPFLDDARRCGINAFTITGGEPMLHPHFFELLEGIYRRDMYVEELNTNGFFLTPEALDRMRSMGCRPLMKISLDGLGHHDWLRNRQGAEEAALRAIRLCIEHGFPVKVQTNLFRGNEASMLPTACQLDRMGVSELRIIRTTESLRWRQNAPGRSLSIEEYYRACLEFLAGYCGGEHHMTVDLWQFAMAYPEQKLYILRTAACGPGEYRDSLPVCRGNRGMAAVAANGNVYPCHQMSGWFEGRGLFLGNVKERGLQPLLQSGPYLDAVCTTVKMLADHTPECAGCEYFTRCCGGCRTIAGALTGDLLGADPAKCLFWKQGYLEQLREVMKGWDLGN